MAWHWTRVMILPQHDDIIKLKHFPRYGPFVRGINQSPVDPPHKGQWREALVISSICAWANGWVNDQDTGHLRHHRAHYDATVLENKILSNDYSYIQH